MNVLRAFAEWMNKTFPPKEDPLRQCVQCGALEGTVFCDRQMIPRPNDDPKDLCRFVPIRPCEKCNSNSLCFGNTGNGNCPLGERVERNRRGCKDSIKAAEAAKRKEAPLGADDKV